MARFGRAIGSVVLAEDGRQLIQTALVLGIDLHAGDVRTHEPYSHHLARVGIRLVEELGVTDPVTIASAPVHDTIEDHARELVQRAPGVVLPDPSLLIAQRAQARSALASLLGSQETADVVAEVSNPITLPGYDKTASYVGHIARLVESGSQRAIVLKLADFLDNSRAAVGEDPNKRRRLDLKQIQVYDLFLRSLERPDGLVPTMKREYVRGVLLQNQQLALGRTQGPLVA
jgi:(p)ppGpp synthase/HD superfamily hydrolase